MPTKKDTVHDYIIYMLRITVYPDLFNELSY